MTQDRRQTTIFSLGDLNTEIDVEPRVSHCHLASSLGMARHSEMRRLIERNMPEFERYGEVCGMIPQTSVRGGRPGKILWLNEGQAILAAIRSDAPRAPEVRFQLITVFIEYRRSKLEKPIAVKAHDRRTSTSVDRAVKLKTNIDRLERVVNKVVVTQPSVVPYQAAETPVGTFMHGDTPVSLDMLREIVHQADMTSRLRGTNLGRAMVDSVEDTMGNPWAGPKVRPEDQPQYRGRKTLFRDDILRMIGEGVQNREIARLTGATYQTVTHWRRWLEDRMSA